MKPQLRRNLPEHFQESGLFSPFTYSIGLESSLQEATAVAQSYPLPQPVGDETYLAFARSLTLVHEATHVAQFFTTTFGLKTLRYTLILLKRLLEGPPWRIPLLQTLFDKDEPTKVEGRVLDSALLFLDTIDQIRLHQQYAPPEKDAAGDVEVDFLPWSPSFFMDERTQDLSYRRELKEAFEAGGLHVRRLPVLRWHDPQASYGIVLNAAALMESYATMTELNHIGNAFGWTLTEGMELLPPDNRYHVVTRYVLQTNVCDITGLLPTLFVCLDAALMYDAFVLFDVPWDRRDAEGRAEQYTGDTFLTLCDAVREIGQLESNRDEDVAEFYRRVCAKAGLPAPEWMAEKAYEVAERIVSTNPSPKALLAKAIRAHRDALALRLKRGPVFPFYLPRMDPLFEVLTTVKSSISFYNLNTRSPESFDPEKVDALTVHSILFQAIAQSSVECPLKMGEPFFCPSAALPPESLCVWVSEGRKLGECLVDLLERLFGFTRAPTAAP